MAGTAAFPGGAPVRVIAAPGTAGPHHPSVLVTGPLCHPAWVTSPPLPLTGERTLPGLAEENYWFRRHEAVYGLFAPLCRDATVLEAGCGEGYGGQRLHDAGARIVVGVDCDGPTLAHLHTAYPALAPVRANLVALPLRDESVDVVVCSQVVEHLWDQPGFVGECARVLRPGGRLLISTPNRLTFPPGNIFHSRELDPAELVSLVGAALDVRRVLGVSHGPRLRRWEAQHGDLVGAQIARPPAEWDRELRELVGSVSAADFVVGEHAVDASLDLVVVAERP